MWYDTAMTTTPGFLLIVHQRDSSGRLKNKSFVSDSRITIARVLESELHGRVLLRDSKAEMRKFLEGGDVDLTFTQFFVESPDFKLNGNPVGEVFASLSPVGIVQ